MKSAIKSFLVGICTSICLIAQVNFCLAQNAALLPNALQQYFDNNGNPLSAGSVQFYIPNTTTPKTVWKDANETLVWPNPIILDAGGKPPGSAAGIYGQGTYRQVVKDANGNLIWDAVTASTGSGGGTTATGDGDLVGTIKPWGGIQAPNQYLFAYGQSISRTTYSALLTAITQSSTVICNSTSNTLTGLSDTTQIPIGAPIEVSCMAPGTVVVSKTSSSVVGSNPATISINTTAQFFPFGNGDGTTTFNLPDLRGYVIAGRDNMGGTAAFRLTTTYFGVNSPDAQGATGGSQSKTLLTANLPPYTPVGSVSVLNNFTGITASTTSPYLTGGSATTGSGASAISTASGVNINDPGHTHTASFTGTAQGGTSTPISAVQPTFTLNYIIKVTPDTNSAIATGVTSLGSMTGDIACGSGLLCTGNTISVTGFATLGPGQILGNYSSLTSAPTASNWIASGTSCPTWLSAYQFFANTNGAPTNTTLGIWDGTNCVPWGIVNSTAHTFSFTSINSLNFFSTRTQAIAASIDPSVSAITIGGYTTVLDGAQGAVYNRTSHIGSPTAWQFNSADGAGWTLTTPFITPEMFGCVGDGITDNTSCFKSIATYINTLYPGATLNLKSNANYAIWPSDPLGVQLVIFRNVNGLTINFNGAKLTTVASFANPTTVINVQGNSQNITFNDPHYEQTAFGNVTPNELGGYLIYVGDDGVTSETVRNVFVNNIYVKGAAVGFGAYRGNDTTSVTGLVINGGYFDTVEYPLTFSKAGDSFIATGIYVTNVGRAYFPTNVKNHWVSLTGNYVANVSPTILLKDYCVAGESDDYNTLQNIHVNANFTSSGVNSTGIGYAGIQIQQNTATSTSCIVKDIELNLNANSLGAGASSNAIFIQKIDSSGVGDSATRGHLLENIRFNGKLVFSQSPITAFSGFNSASEQWYASGSASTIAASTSSFTASIASNVMTVTAVGSGTIYPGTNISGTGVGAGTQILKQLTGSAGSTGTYQVSIAQTTSSTTISGTYGTLTVGGSVSGAFAVGDIISGTGVSANTYLTAFISGTGGAGTYVVNKNTVVGSTSIVGADRVRNIVFDNFIATGSTSTNSIVATITNLIGPFDFKNITVDQPVSITGGTGSNLRYQNITAPSGLSDAVAVIPSASTSTVVTGLTSDGNLTSTFAPILGSGANAGSLRLYDNSSTNLVGLQASGGTTAYTFFLPSSLGTSGQILTSQGVGNPTLWSSTIIPTAIGVGGAAPATGIEIYNAAVALTGNGQGVIGASATNGLVLGGQGSTNDVVLQNNAAAIACRVATGTQTFNCSTLSLTNPLGVASGGTSTNTLTAHAVILGNTTSAVNFATIGTAGRVLTDNGAGSDPTFQSYSHPIVSTTNAAIVAGSTVFCWFQCAPTVAWNTYTVAMSGTVKNLNVFSSIPGAGQSYTMTLYYGGGATALTCTISGAASQTCSDNTHTQAVVAGQAMNLQIVTSAGAASSGFGYSVVETTP